MAKRGRPLPQLTPLEKDFVEHLKSEGRTPLTIEKYRGMVRRFLKHVGNTPLNRISEDVARAYFAGIKDKTAAIVISGFLNFAVARLPVPVAGRGATTPLPAAKDAKELALRQQWAVDKLAAKKEAGEDLIAKLARKLIDHYLYFQKRIQGEDENLDDVHRFAAECQELIQTNLPLFMQLSAEGRNLHPIIDERINRR